MLQITYYPIVISRVPSPAPCGRKGKYTVTIQHAILGLLSWRPFSGYDLKKAFADSTVFYWSGNSNQIYKALVQLHQDGLVTQDIQHQESLPTKKVYSITETGRAALEQWVLTTPELPEFRSTFLVQLAWADTLDAGSLDALLGTYEEEVRVQILMQQEKARRPATAPARTPREAYLWTMINQNVISAYESELRWVRDVRAGIGAQNTKESATGASDEGVAR